MVRAFFSDEGIVAPGHHGHVVRMPLFQGDLLDHRLNGRFLFFSAEGHEHRSGADGRVKALGQAALGAEIEVTGQLLQVVRKAAFHRLCNGPGLGRMGLGVLFRAVGVQKLARDVDDFLPVPVHHQAGFFRHRGHLAGLQVFLPCQFQEAGTVLGSHHHGHSFLGL